MHSNHYVKMTHTNILYAAPSYARALLVLVQSLAGISCTYIYKISDITQYTCKVLCLMYHLLVLATCMKAAHEKTNTQ